MLFYFSPLLSDGKILSCDNIRLNLRFLSLDALSAFCRSIKDMYVNHYDSFKDFSYRHLFVFQGQFATFTVGVSLNGVSAEQSLYGFLDFNPNKVLGNIWYGDGFVNAVDSPFTPGSALAYSGDERFWDVWSMLRTYCLDMTVKRFDFAVDIECQRGRIQLFKEDQRRYSQFWRSPENYTEYLGTKNEGGRVKVYNKSIESELDYPLTRIECTCDSFEYARFQKCFPKVYYRRLLNLGKEGVMVQLLSKVPSDELDFYMRQLSAPSRRKYRAALVQEPLEVSLEEFQKVVLKIKQFEL